MQLFSKTLRIFANSAKGRFFRPTSCQVRPRTSFSFLFISLSPLCTEISHPLVIHYKYRPTSSFRGCIRQHIRTHRPSFRNTGQVAPPPAAAANVSATNWVDTQSLPQPRGWMAISDTDRSLKNPSAKLDEFRFVENEKLSTFNFAVSRTAYWRVWRFAVYPPP